MKKITVFYGNYGSGKTELSLSVALELAREHDDVSLVDLDIVNPYFRSSEHRSMLERHGVRLIAPAFANTGVDLPTIPPDIYAAFKGGHVVFDCGGDPVGATALGGLKERFERVRYDTEVLFVVNTKRPFQENAQRIMESFERVQSSARLTADGFVLNSNLGTGTTGDELPEDYEIMKELEALTGVPLLYVSGTESSLERFKKQHPEYDGGFITLGILTRPEWL